jgi:hypothetical protein
MLRDKVILYKKKDAHRAKQSDNYQVKIGREKVGEIMEHW